MVVLASASPRRRAMLEQAGVAHRVSPAGIDDGDLVPGHSTCPQEWVVALAYLKATSSIRTIQDEAFGGVIVVLGADTVCVQGGEIIGQPDDRDHARAIIEQMRSDTHEVLTGVAIVDPTNGRRELFVDRSIVTVGAVPDHEIEAYLDSELWRGKAGAYNITERLAAGWPITFTGDETSIVGLPLSRTLDRVARFLVD
jgi:nucleoside triphosphate pyrophosphatase